MSLEQEGESVLVDIPTKFIQGSLQMSGNIPRNTTLTRYFDRPIFVAFYATLH